MSRTQVTVVKEYDWIVKQSSELTGPRCIRISDTNYENLTSFIREFQAKDSGADVLDFMSIRYQRGGEYITIKNYVGLIELKNNFQIEILPKVFFGSETATLDPEETTRAVFLKMLRALRSFPGKIFTDANLKTSKMNLYEVFISMYIREAQMLVKRGLKSAYVSQEDNIRYYKGKLIVSQHLKLNSAHKERFFMKFDEFLPNRPENRLIKATLLKFQRLTSSSKNAKDIRQLLTAFDQVDASANYVKDFSLVILDRNSKDYETLMSWSKVFLMSKSFTTFSGSTQSKALLFKMNDVFEDYVAKEVKRTFSPAGWEVTAQCRQHHLFDIPKIFLLKPDIYMKKGDKVIVLDTKWKRLVNDRRKNYGISQADVYQMYAYSKKYHAKDIWLLYPENEESEGIGNDLSFQAYEGEPGEANIETHVHVFFVNVAQIQASLEELKRKIEPAQE